LSDISVRITLVEDVGKKLSNMAAAARKASSQMDSVGKAVDKAFRSSSMDSFSSKAGTMFASATSGAESFGAAAEEAKSAVEGLESAASEIGSSMASASGAYQDANGRWHDANGRFIASAGKVSDSMKKIQESASGIDPQPLDEIGREAGEAGRKLDGAASSALNLGNVLKTALAAVSVAK